MPLPAAPAEALGRPAPQRRPQQRPKKAPVVFDAPPEAVDGTVGLRPRRRSPVRRPGNGSTPGASGCRTSSSSFGPSPSRTSAASSTATRSTPRSCDCRSTPRAFTSSRSTRSAPSSSSRRTRISRPSTNSNSPISPARSIVTPADDVLGLEVPGAVEPRFAAPETTGDAIATVAAGVGAVIVPMSLARLHQRRDAASVPLRDGPLSQVALAWRTDRTTPLVEAFVGIVRGRTANSSRG